MSSLAGGSSGEAAGSPAAAAGGRAACHGVLAAAVALLVELEAAKDSQKANYVTGCKWDEDCKTLCPKPQGGVDSIELLKIFLRF